MTDLGVGLISQPSEIFFWISSTKHEDDSLTMRIHLAISGSLVGLSLLTVTLIGVDRYLALKLIKLHLRYKELITTRRAICTAVVIWVSSISTFTGTLIILKQPLRAFKTITCPNIVACFIINTFVYQKLKFTGFACFTMSKFKIKRFFVKILACISELSTMLDSENPLKLSSLTCVRRELFSILFLLRHSSPNYYATYNKVNYNFRFC